MNIFYLDPNPQLCAQYHVNKHVVKMILETYILLRIPHLLSHNSKLSWRNHPCAIWARSGIENYKWLKDLGLELCKEYSFRYCKKHKLEDKIRELQVPTLPPGGTFPALAMPNKYKGEDPVKSYRDYYLNEKTHLFKWGSREKPGWVK